VDVFAEGRKARKALNQFIGQVFRVGSGETKSAETGNATQYLEQVRKPKPLAIRSTIGIHVLSQQGQLLDPTFCQTRGLVEE
jgi:hypothetical protein